MRFKKVKVDESGWSEWQAPVMDGYKMACCDCGLVHTMEFQAVRETKSLPNGAWVFAQIKNGRVLMRARRNERSTAAMRRERKKKR